MPPRAKTAAPSSRQVISRQLREVIRTRGLTAYSLGRRADIDPGIIQRFLNEERDIKLDTLDRLADVLGLRLVEGSRGRGRPTRSPQAGRSAETQPDQHTATGPSQPERSQHEPAGPETEAEGHIGPQAGAEHEVQAEVPTNPGAFDPTGWSGDPDESDPPESPDPIAATQEQPWWES